MFSSPAEIAFSIGNIKVHYYGIIMALALFCGTVFSAFICKKHYKKINSDIIYDIAPIILVAAIIGARLYYCILNFQYYSKHILEIFQIWQGGLSIHGGLIGGLIAGFIYTQRHKLNFLKICDIFTYGIVLGQIIGRWGNFFNSEAFGLPCNNFLKLYIPISKRPLEYIQYSFFHPTFLYESILNIFVLIILYFIIRKKTNKSGIIFFSYLIMYSIIRIFIEHIRIDSVLNIAGFPIAQIVSLFIIVISLIAIYFIQKTSTEED